MNTVKVDCQNCETVIDVDAKTFELSHEVSDGKFQCDKCHEDN